jgi:hypothetical protein|tara:strand:+ start:469 stop:987 length:519 start_codon:yes stop_codon:yes gene_type:complete
MSTLNDKLAQIQTELKASKSRFNSFGKYSYRSAEDILESIKPFLIPLGVTVRVYENLIDSSVIQTTAIISDGKDELKAQSIVGVDLEQKGMQMPQKFGSASSYGKKYALGNLFLIDDTKDSDALNTHNNKPKLLENTPQFKKVKDALNNGYSLEDIKKKYTLTSDIIKQLTD